MYPGVHQHSYYVSYLGIHDGRDGHSPLPVIKLEVRWYGQLLNITPGVRVRGGGRAAVGAHRRQPFPEKAGRASTGDELSADTPRAGGSW